MSRNLILYYSRKGENYVNGEIKFLEKGNTEICAEYIQEAVGGDLFEIETVQEYPADYTQTTIMAKEELAKGKRPALKRMLDDADAYDNIFVCGPCWWSTYPCAVFSQLEVLDFKGKKVIPLMTHEGSGMGHVLQDLKKSCKGAVFGNSMAVHGADALMAKEAVSKWARENA